MIITVTQDHIDGGFRGSSCNCPVALAVQEALKNNSLLVSRLRIWSINDYTRCTYLPKRVTRWIDDYDNKLPVAPFSFEVSL